MKGGQNFIDLTNRKFGRLVVIARAEDRVYKDGKKHVNYPDPKGSGLGIPTLRTL
jgi:hypothetical protein